MSVWFLNHLKKILLLSVPLFLIFYHKRYFLSNPSSASIRTKGTLSVCINWFYQWMSIRPLGRMWGKRKPIHIDNRICHREQAVLRRPNNDALRFCLADRNFRCTFLIVFLSSLWQYRNIYIFTLATVKRDWDSLQAVLAIWRCSKWWVRQPFAKLVCHRRSEYFQSFLKL